MMGTPASPAGSSPGSPGHVSDWASTELGITTSAATESTAFPEVLCSAAPAIPNAAMDSSSVNGSIATGHVASYTCHPGYHLSSGDAQLTCSTNGTWSGALPACSSTSDGITYISVIIVFVLAAIFLGIAALWLIQDFGRYHHKKNSNSAKKIRKMIEKSAIRPGLFYIKIPPEKLSAQINAIPPPSLAHMERERELYGRQKLDSRSLRSLKKKQKKHRKTLSIGPEMEFQGYYHNEVRSEHVGGVEDLAPVAGSFKSSATTAEIHEAMSQPAPRSDTTEPRPAPVPDDPLGVEEGVVGGQPPRKKKNKSLLRRANGDNEGNFSRANAVDMPETDSDWRNPPV